MNPAQGKAGMIPSGYIQASGSSYAQSLLQSCLFLSHSAHLRLVSFSLTTRELPLLLPFHTHPLFSCWVCFPSRQHYYKLHKERHLLEVCLTPLKLVIFLLELQLVFLVISNLPPLTGLTTTIIFPKVNNYKS